MRPLALSLALAFAATLAPTAAGQPPCTAIVAFYGDGCAGSAGRAPRLELVGCPRPGAALTLAIQNGLGQAAGILVVGGDSQFFPLPGGCQVLVLPPLTVLPVVLGGAAGEPGAGEFSLPLLVPAQPDLVGRRFNMQALVWDAGAYGSISATDGLQFVIGK
ncbi:MAG: hypothetical protein AAF628_27355 [Planctomycetota bacterium]